MRTGNRTLGPLKKYDSSIDCVAFSPNGRQIASGLGNGNILVWDVVTGNLVTGPFEGHTQSICCVSFSPDGKRIASGSSDTTIRVWDAEMGDVLIGPLPGGAWIVSSIAFSGDGLQIASTSPILRLWDAKSGQLVHGSWEQEQGIDFVVFSPDRKRIITSSFAGVSVWDVGRGALVAGPSKAHAEGTLAWVFTSNAPLNCPISPDGKWIVGTTYDFKVCVWESKTGRLAATFEEHTQFIWCIFFSPDGKWILSSSDNNTLLVHSLDL